MQWNRQKGKLSACALLIFDPFSLSTTPISTLTSSIVKGLSNERRKIASSWRIVNDKVSQKKCRLGTLRKLNWRMNDWHFLSQFKNNCKKYFQFFFDSSIIFNFTQNFYFLSENFVKTSKFSLFLTFQNFENFEWKFSKHNI